ncbi:MAG: hypothetical protein IT198_08775 [Acidimicrobiia bacterium]|nr:hypothetical protein [Acidimicrobiia bacterium]
MTTEDRKVQRSGDPSAGSQDSTVHASEHGDGRDRRGIDLRRGLDRAARRVGTWNARATASGEEVGRAVRDTLFRHERGRVLPPRTRLEYPGLLEAEAGPGLLPPDPVLIPHTALAASGRGGGSARRGGRHEDRPREDQPREEGSGGATQADADTAPPSGDILPPPTSQPTPPARRVASGVVLVAIAIGIGLILSISLIIAVAWGASTVINYFGN